MIKPGQKIRVLVVDDSALMRQRISAMVNSAADMEVIAAARDGEEAIKIVVALRPDVITLDIQMPRMDGLTCLGYIMSEWPTPVIMLSAFTREGGAATVQAMEYGAVDFVPKPSGVVSLDIERVKVELLHKIRIAYHVNIKKLKFLLRHRAKKFKEKLPVSLNKVVAIGGSTGGPRALAEIIPQFPPDLPAGVLVIQHMPAAFTRPLAERLNWESKISVKEAENGEAIEPGRVLVAPGDFQMTVKSVKKEREVIEVKSGPKEHFVAPSVDITMRSLAPVYGRNAIGVVLTGMGDDGTDGLRSIKEYGGSTISEAESTCVVYGMPRAALEAGVVDKVVPLDGIAKEIIRSVKHIS